MVQFALLFSLKKWKYFFSYIPVHSSPTVANGIVYVGASDGLYAIDTKTGLKKWRVT
jgi:outer membrane protein assembly factor BamB